MRGDRDSTHTRTMRVRMPRVCRSTGVRLASQHILSMVGRHARLNFHVPDRHGMVIPLHSPCYFHQICALGPDHQPDGVGIGLRGSFAVAAGVAEIAVAA